MQLFHSILTSFALIFLSPIFVHAQASSLTATVSINEDPDWIIERACGRGCVWIDSGHYGAPYPDILLHLNCDLSALNACFCRSDFGTSVTTFLRSCVSSRCKSDGITDYGTEIFTALSLYSHYCDTAVGVVFPAPTVTAPSVSACSTLLTVTVTVSASAGETAKTTLPPATSTA